MSFDHGGKADLCLAMGSSLTVTPAANIPEVLANDVRLRFGCMVEVGGGGWERGEGERNKLNVEQFSESGYD